MSTGRRNVLGMAGTVLTGAARGQVTDSSSTAVWAHLRERSLWDGKEETKGLWKKKWRYMKEALCDRESAAQVTHTRVGTAVGR